MGGDHSQWDQSLRFSERLVGDSQAVLFGRTNSRSSYKSSHSGQQEGQELLPVDAWQKYYRKRKRQQKFRPFWNLPILFWQWDRRRKYAAHLLEIWCGRTFGGVCGASVKDWGVVLQRNCAGRRGRQRFGCRYGDEEQRIQIVYPSGVWTGKGLGGGSGAKPVSRIFP